MNTKYFKYAVMVLALGLTTTSCEDFLDRPDEDNPSMSNYYRNDSEVKDGILSLYNATWHDFVSTGYYKIGDVMSGNVYMGGDAYMAFTVNGKDPDLISTSTGLWAANAQANTMMKYLQKATCSESVKNATMGECLTWKALAYFYLVRIFGNIPIIHNNEDDIATNSYNNKPLVMKSDVYEYIVMTLEKAIELLPESNDPGRIDKWGAKGLLAKVYLAKSGVNAGGNGQRNQTDLDKAAEYAEDVIKNSGKLLMENYADVFKGENNCCDESLIGLRWNCNPSIYTYANPLSLTLCMNGFGGIKAWGDWTSPSKDLMDAFGVDPLENPAMRIETDTRRKASFMMAGDTYDYFWRNKTYDNKINGKGKGFDYLQFLYDDNYYSDETFAGIKKQGLQSMSGANIAKHQYGNIQDHVDMFGSSPTEWGGNMSTHILRLADVYLIFAEAKIGNNNNTTDADAIDAFYEVRHRAISSYTKPASITLDDVLKERRLELAFEGDYWYDLVRLSYYNLEKAKNILLSSKRGRYEGLGGLEEGVFAKYWESGTWDASSARYNSSSEPTFNVNESTFTLPMLTDDVEYNPLLKADPVHIDVRSTYSY